jgi:hypothetical protein
MLGNCLAELLSSSLNLFSELLPLVEVLLPLVEVLLSRLRKLPLQLLHLGLTSNSTFGRNRNKQRNPKQTSDPGPHVAGVIFPAFFLRIVFGLMVTHCVLHLPSLALVSRHCFQINAW